ncbi:MAG TPA: hypothetical protein VL742_09185 [Casimicrobiaceae bacterium]|nr:hypothetical protein [Casimicrobiaceae bacterium]
MANTGNNPARVARQLGHVNAQMVFRIYAPWIDRADKSRERDRFNAALGAASGHLGHNRRRFAITVLQREEQL